MRLTDRKQAIELAKKENKTKEESIYLELSKYENAIEDKQLFSKRQLNNAITKATEMLASVVRIQLSKEVVKTLNELLKHVAKDGKVDLKDVESMSMELIKRIEGAK